MVDLPDGRKLLVLFTRTPTGIGPPEWLANSEAIRAELTTGQAPQRSADRDADGDGMADLPFFSPVPYLVTFRDPRDPASIVQVDPLDLAATFGRGYRLRRVMLKPLAADPFSLGTGEQPVGLDPPSRVLAALPWLRSFRQAPITRPDGSTPFPDDLDRSSFIEP
ncbi:hypothetical protein [Sphingomonas bacterium]|uniref:hypothetical protein n=1 Tax=Sphingomonas bacterium TaxID=1895847 RepID=UPI0015762852|nr:hypothetical protein [Sphingomonas bacterium]